jgi:hypothetical protein
MLWKQSGDSIPIHQGWCICLHRKAVANPVGEQPNLLQYVSCRRIRPVAVLGPARKVPVPSGHESSGHESSDGFSDGHRRIGGGAKLLAPGEALLGRARRARGWRLSDD